VARACLLPAAVLLAVRFVLAAGVPEFRSVEYLATPRRFPSECLSSSRCRPGCQRAAGDRSPERRLLSSRLRCPPG
jgi:hypothetical protein